MTIKHSLTFIQAAASLIAAAIVSLRPATAQSAEARSLIESIKVSAPLNAPDDGTYWFQARAAVLPESKTPDGDASTPVVITLQKTDRVGTHMYHGLSAMWSDNLGVTWTGPDAVPELDRIVHTNGLLEAPVDMTPQFHQKSGKLLVTGATFWLDPKLHHNVRGARSDTSYAVYDPKTQKWSRWQRLEMPPGPKFHSSRAGCSQRVDLPNGDVLLPFYFRGHSAVMRCSFDGTSLRYLEHGTELTVTNVSSKSRKGLGESSLTRFDGKFYLTMRNDERGYVSTSDDGLHFSQPKRWRFDDGKELGSYNTQQHWVTHSDGLFLAYTRRGANNDNVFRNRAPVFIARVDPKKLVVERASEKILLPNLGEGFGNFGVCNINPEETWVVSCLHKAKAGTPNLFIAKIHWAKPNHLVDY